MGRSKRALMAFVLCQVILLVAGWALLSVPLSAQKSDVRAPIVGPYKVLPSSADGTSATIGVLPPHKPGHGYISVSSAAFQPTETGYVYQNYGKGILRLDSSDTQFQSYISPVLLPPGARVTGLVMVGGDTVADVPGNRDGTMALSLIQSELDRLDLQGSPASERELALALSYPNTPLLGDLGIYTTTQTLTASVDLEHFAYFLKVDMPRNNMVFRSARIEYAYPNTYLLPVLRRDQ